MTNAELLRDWRARRGLSQSQLARLLGVSVRTLQEWEQARFPGPRGRLLPLALAALDRELDGAMHPKP